MTTCGACGRGGADGMRFCTGCGAALPATAPSAARTFVPPPGPGAPNASLHGAETAWGPAVGPPVPSAWPHTPGHGGGPVFGPVPPVGPPAPRERSSRGLVVALVVLLVVAVGLGVVLVTGVGRSTDAAPAPVVPAAVTPLPPGATVSPRTSSVPAAADPSQALATTRAGDAPVAESMVGSWVPQLSAKNVGLVADGRTYDAAAIWADHQGLRAVRPAAFLVWSGDYTSYRSADFWVTLVAQPFATADQVTAWCVAQGFAPTQCLAKRLSHTGGPQGNTVQRPGS